MVWDIPAPQGHRRPRWRRCSWCRRRRAAGGREFCRACLWEAAARLFAHGLLNDDGPGRPQWGTRPVGSTPVLRE